jgi:hypothetical protein
MEKLRIYYSFKGNGISFSLLPSDCNLLKDAFPEAQPAMGIFVQYDIRSDFRNYHAQLENYIFPAIAGLPKMEDLKKISVVEFIKTPGRIVTYEINNYEQEVQPIPG